MSKTYNVNREVNDTFYRYKMPAITAKVEGKGNGIKTVIVNMVDIARALNREAIYPTKYFGIELGAQTHIDATNERYIVNGSHDEDKLQGILDGYIKKFVLCQECYNPETKLTVRKNGIIQTCQACGYKGELRSIAHGLANFIIKQHKTAGKKSKKDDKKKEETTKDIYAKDRTEVKVKQSSKKGEEWEGGEWDSDSEDELAEQTKNLSLKEMKPENMTPEQRGMAFEEYIDEIIDGGNLPDMMKAKEKIMDIVLKADYYQLRNKGTLCLFDKLLVEQNFMAGLKKYRALFVLMNRYTSNGESDEKAMKNTMYGMEVFFGKFESHVDKCAHFVKALYDLDIVDDEQIVEWGESKPSKKYVSKELSGTLKEKAKKVIEWLKSAETESESEEESDEDEIAFDDSAKVGQVVAEQPVVAKAPVEEVKAAEVINSDGEAEEIDIDDI